MQKQLFGCFLLVAACLAMEVINNQPYTAFYDSESQTWQVTSSSVPGAALGWFNASAMLTGWHQLTIISNASVSDYDQAYAAGFLEASLTQQQTWNAWLNYANGTEYPASAQLLNWVTAQDKWVRGMVTSNPSSEYWQQVGLVLAQFDGIMAGYSAQAPSDQQLSYSDQLLYALNWEVGDINIAIANQIPEGPIIGAHCSVLVKVSGDGESLLATHDTWSQFLNMLRVYKHYELSFSLSSNVAPASSFSSFPSNLVSGDDFYVTSQNLVVMETTNDVFNSTLYQMYVTPQTVPYWIRVLVANRMASSGAEWSKIFAEYNSGTYNNQWQIVDNKLFTPGQPLQPNTLWIAEQIPGYVVSNDITDVLVSQGYFPSYNVPFFPFIYNISGYPAMFEKYGNMYSYTNCARANIFRRDQHTVVDVPSLQKLMRYNEWQTDPLSLGDACRGISARCDLNPPWAINTMNSYGAFGGIDNKLTTSDMSPTRTALAVCGPTWDSQPVFAWTEQWQYIPHYGMPEVFDFEYDTMAPYSSNIARNIQKLE